jgi:hypothetical protein
VAALVSLVALVVVLLEAYDLPNGSDWKAAERVTVRIRDYPLFLFTLGIAATFAARPIAQTMTIESMGETP